MKTPVVKRQNRMSNLEVLQLYARLKALKHVSGIKLNRAIALTMQSLKPVVDAYDQELLIPKSEDFKQFESEMQKAYALIASQSGDKPRTLILHSDSGDYEALDFDINGEQAQFARAELQHKYRDAIEIRKADARDYNEWLKNECEDEFRLFKVSLAEMPKDGLIDYKMLWDACILLIEEE